MDSYLKTKGRWVRCIVSYLLSVSLLAGAKVPLWASCGLEGCPLFREAQVTDRTRLQAELATRQVEFNVGGAFGHYTQVLTRLEYRGGWQRFIAGGFASLVFLDRGSAEHIGVTNPVLFGEYQVIDRASLAVTFGNQFEIPVGTNKHGIAPDHAEFVPYVTLTNKRRKTWSSATLGFRLSLNNSHGHKTNHDDSLVVNPHEDREFLYRVLTGFTLGRLKPELFVDGQHVLKGNESGKGFLTVGTVLGILLGKNYKLRPLFEYPVTFPKRIQWKVALNLVGKF